MTQRTAALPAWWSTEQAIYLNDLPDHLPRRRGGRKTHVASVYRWAKPGLRGVCLRTFMAGGQLATTREEVDRFFAKLTAGTPTRANTSDEELRQRRLL